MATSDVRDQLQTALGDAYRIEREIPRGGMSRLFLATEGSLDRQVVIKLLPPELASEVSAARFQREVTLTAHLQHPHILPILSAGSKSGLLYYVMPFVEGESLRQRLDRDGKLPVLDAVQILREVADALARAHKAGIVHRDIKPANILLQDDHALLADFGVARALHEAAGDPRLTDTGIGLGTSGYMAPEQLAGERNVDARADVYALAVVGYEMLVGVGPFTGSTPQAVAAAHFTLDPKPVAQLRSDVSPAVSDAIATALAREPDARFATAAAFRDALAVADGRRAAMRQVTRRWMTAAIVGALVVAAIVGAIAWRARAHAPAGPPTIAVLPFKNMSDDPANEYFSDGMTDELTGALARIPGLGVSARSSAFVFKGKNVNARAVGDSLHVETVLEASVFRAGPQLHVVATLVNAKTGRTMWSETYDREWRDVLALQTEIAQSIARQLRVKLLRGDSVSLVARQTANAEAYDNYLKGRFFISQRTAPALDQAVTYFQQALGIDSTYARAYSGLADSYSLLAAFGRAPREMLPLAKRAAEHALGLDSMLAEAHTSRAIVSIFYEWEWGNAQRELDRAIALDSTYAPAFFWSAFPYAARGRLTEAARAVTHARTLEPLSQIYNTRLAEALIWQRRYPEAEAQLRQTLEINPSYGGTRAQLAHVLAMQGRFADAVAALPAPGTHLNAAETGVPGFVYARAGKRAEALREIRAMEARPYVPADGIALVFAGLGDKDAALAWLDKACDARAFSVVFLNMEPMWDTLRDDARFRRLVARVGLVGIERGRRSSPASPA